MSYPAPPPTPPPYGMPSPQPPQRSNVGIIVAVVVGIVVLACGGLVTAVIYAVGAFTDAVESGLDDYDGPGSASDPIAVGEGQPFEIDEVSYEKGWVLDLTGPNAAGVAGLRATNEESGTIGSAIRVDVDLVVDGLAVATVRCRSEGLVDPGDTEELDCTTFDDLPRRIDRIDVSQPY